MRDLPNACLIATAAALVFLPCGQAVADDFDGDGMSDILWRNSANGQNWLYTMDGAVIETTNYINTISNLDWKFVGTGDYDNDGDSDIVLRNSATGQNWLYQMDGSTIDVSTQINIVPNLDWEIVGDGDYDGNGKADILLRNSLTGQNWLYLMDGPTISSSLSINTVANLNWQIAASADFNGDGKSDIWLRNSVTGQNWLYLMNGAMIQVSTLVNVVANTDWTIAGSGDYNGNGNADILWYNTTNGQLWVYLLDGATIQTSSYVGTVANLDWEVIGDGDYDGDGRSDILWRNRSTGQNLIYRMNGASILAVLGVNTVSNLDWRIFGATPPFLDPSGYNARPSNTTCIAPAQPTTNASIAAEEAFPNLPDFTNPIALLQAPGDSSQWYLVEQDGRILRFDNSPTVSTTSTYIDIRESTDPIDVHSGCNECGLLGMAFHPDYATGNWDVYLSYMLAGPRRSVVAHFESKDSGGTLDATDETELLTVRQPFSNHNGGHIVFGPDDNLYIGFGDGGSSGDPDDHAQNTMDLLGTLLRIDVDGGTPYAIPMDNPFALNDLCDDGTGSAACPEIYAWGLRNPWRWNFDAATGDLWLADVGQSSYEEVNLVELGGNYGWRCREGAHDFDTTGICPPGLIDPLFELSHASGDGDSITGGFVYRGTAIPELIGRYVFADYVNGTIFASVSDGQGGYDYELLLDTSFFISSFAEDENGELLFLNYGGDIRRIVQSGGSSNNTIPDQLSATGCVNAVDPTQPAAGMIPYEMNVPFWSDGADKERFYAIPNGTTIDVDTDGDWLFPNGTVLMKNFRLNGELFETRLFMRHTNGEWGGYTYEWNGAGTDADRVVGGKTKTVQGQSWTYPSESQCMNCHTQAANFSLGLEHGQLNQEMTYPSGIVANQLITADKIDMLTLPLDDDPENLSLLAEAGGSGSQEDQARSYLHSNCAGCHRPTGPTPSNIDLRFSTALAATNTCDVEPTLGDLGVSNARLVSPGASAESIIPNRMNRRDVHGMPPLASAIADAAGVTLINQWIDSLSGCP